MVTTICRVDRTPSFVVVGFRHIFQIYDDDVANVISGETKGEHTERECSKSIDTKLEKRV